MAFPLAVIASVKLSEVISDSLTGSFLVSHSSQSGVDMLL